MRKPHWRTSKGAADFNFEVSEATVSSWRKQARVEGRHEAKEHAGGRVMLAGDLPELDTVVAEHTDAQLAEYARLLEERTGRRHSLPALCRALQRLGWRRKKSPCTPASSSAPMFRRIAKHGARISPLGAPKI